MRIKSEGTKREEKTIPSKEGKIGWNQQSRASTARVATAAAVAGVEGQDMHWTGGGESIWCRCTAQLTGRERPRQSTRSPTQLGSPVDDAATAPFFLLLLLLLLLSLCPIYKCLPHATLVSSPSTLCLSLCYLRPLSLFVTFIPWLLYYRSRYFIIDFVVSGLFDFASY